MGPAVGGGDVDGQGVSGLLDDLQHLQLRVQVQAVAALTLHQGGPGPLHPEQSAAEGGEQLRGAGSPGVLHREVDPPPGPVHVHVGGARQLQEIQEIRVLYVSGQLLHFYKIEITVIICNTNKITEFTYK